jgi:hypothetical protein
MKTKFNAEALQKRLIENVFGLRQKFRPLRRIAPRSGLSRVDLEENTGQHSACQRQGDVT